MKIIPNRPHSRMREMDSSGGKGENYDDMTWKQWWHHQMETFSVLLALCEGNPPVTGGFPSQRPVTQSFDVFFYMCLNKRLSKQLKCQWFEMPSCSLWCHCNDFQDNWPFVWGIHWSPVNSLRLGGTYMHHWNESTVVQVLAWHLLDTKTLPEPMLLYCQWDP